MPDMPNEAVLTAQPRSKTGRPGVRSARQNELDGYTRKTILEYVDLLHRQQQHATAVTLSLIRPLNAGSLESGMAAKDQVINDFASRLEQSGKEIASLRETLKAETLESATQRSAVARLTDAVREKEEEIHFLNTLIASRQVAHLTARINDLTRQLACQAEIIERYSRENAARSQALEAASQDNDALCERVESLTQTLEARDGHSSR